MRVLSYILMSAVVVGAQSPSYAGSVKRDIRGINLGMTPDAVASASPFACRRGSQAVMLCSDDPQGMEYLSINFVNVDNVQSAAIISYGFCSSEPQKDAIAKILEPFGRSASDITMFNGFFQKQNFNIDETTIMQMDPTGGRCMVRTSSENTAVWSYKVTIADTKAIQDAKNAAAKSDSERFKTPHM